MRQKPLKYEVHFTLNKTYETQKNIYDKICLFFNFKVYHNDGQTENC